MFVVICELILRMLIGLSSSTSTKVDQIKLSTMRWSRATLAAPVATYLQPALCAPGGASGPPKGTADCAAGESHTAH